MYEKFFKKRTREDDVRDATNWELRVSNECPMGMLRNGVLMSFYRFGTTFADVGTRMTRLIKKFEAQRTAQTRLYRNTLKDIWEAKKIAKKIAQETRLKG